MRGFPSISAKGLPGKRVELNRAGMIAIAASAFIKHRNSSYHDAADITGPLAENLHPTCSGVMEISQIGDLIRLLLE
jgi:hypothetical protein